MSPALTVSPDALSRELDGEVLVLDLKTSLYFGLTGTAAHIWQLIEQGKGQEDIVAALSREYGGDSAAIAGDVDAFVDDLIARGLVVRSRS